jgi:hypothetical protein
MFKNNVFDARLLGNDIHGRNGGVGDDVRDYI